MIKSFVLSALLLMASSTAVAEPTRVMVRGLALDAKFIGDSMGGVEVTLTDQKGRVLAQGLAKGGTGDTGRIMKLPHMRGGSLTDPATSGFEALLDLDQPTLVTATARAPMGKPASATTVSSQMWVVPGRNVTGDGWILTFPGLVIEPRIEAAANGEVKLQAHVSLMCGCPIEPGGLWDAARYDIEAQVIKGDRILSAVPLTYAGKTSEFAGQLTGVSPGRYRLRLLAKDRGSANAGVVEQTLVVPKP
jgi:hypothetical protein